MKIKTIEEINREFMEREAGIFPLFSFLTDDLPVETLPQEEPAVHVGDTDRGTAVNSVLEKVDTQNLVPSDVKAEATGESVCVVTKPFETTEDVEPKKSKKRKSNRSLTGSLSGFIFYTVIIGVVLLAFVSAGKNGNGPRDIFGYSYFTVLSGSMQKEIPKGSFVLTKKTDTNTLQIGDTITFMKAANTTVTHKIVGIIEDYDKSGARGFQTQGVNNAQPDRETVLAANVIGKVVFSVPGVGAALAVFSDNIILCFIIFGLLLILSFSLQLFFKIKKEEKKEKTEETKNDSHNKKISA